MSKTKSKESTQEYTRLVVETNGVWRVNQIVEILTALDGITARVAVSVHLSEVCDAYDYIISNLHIMGLIQKGDIDKWGMAKTPSDQKVRNDYLSFISNLRKLGVQVQLTEVGAKFSFLTTDIIDIIPVSSRAEIEKINISSPGTFSIILSGLLGSALTKSFLDKIFDPIFFPQSTQMKKQAESREAIAKARKAEAEATKAEIENLDYINRVTLDISVTINNIALSLRNAGFPDNEIKSIVYDSIMRDIDVLARYKSLSMIKSIKAEIV